MRYVLLAHMDGAAMATLSPDEIQVVMGRFISFSEALAEAGLLRTMEQLHGPETATTVRVRDGEALYTDGPYAELPEHFGGYWTVEAPDLDTVLKHAAECPAAQYGSVEVRPLADMS